MMSDPIEEMITHLRSSHPDAVDVFMGGGCVGLAKAIRAIHPGEVTLWHDDIEGHVYAGIQTPLGHWWLYDIRGKWIFPGEPVAFVVLDEEAALKWTPNFRIGK